MVIGTNGYVMGGGYENWKYDATNDQWIQQAFFTERKGGSCFAIGNNGYYGLGSGLGHEAYNSDLWQFSPAR